MKNKHLSGSLFSKKTLTEKESAISSAIAEYLDARRIYHLRLNSGKIKVGSRVIHLCPEGTPDRFCIYKGRPIFIEVKRAGEKPTDVQLDIHERIIKAKGFIVVARSLDDVIRAFKEFDSQASH